MTTTLEFDQPILTNEEQYNCDLKALPRLASHEIPAILAAAKAGDASARERIIHACMPVIGSYAYRLAITYLPGAYLDLVQIGNLGLVEPIDQALTKWVPIPYLYKAAHRDMRDYCIYRSHLIRLPVYPPALQHMPTTTSYEVLAQSSLAQVLADIQPEEHAAYNAFYGFLQEALGQLTALQREAVTRLYGLDERGPETPAELARRLHTTPQRVCNRRREALQRLRKLLKQA
jgi:RNA polymerase sigma factor (sigma-70 family)